jgi:hypothetical protein
VGNVQHAHQLLVFARIERWQAVGRAVGKAWARLSELRRPRRVADGSWTEASSCIGERRFEAFAEFRAAARRGACAQPLSENMYAQAQPIA